MEEFFVHAAVENIYFSDHDATRIVIEKNNADFPTVPKMINQILSEVIYRKTVFYGLTAIHRHTVFNT